MSDDKNKTVQDRIKASWDEGNPSGWFEGLYADAAKGEARVPWAFMEPNSLLVQWLDKKAIDGSGQTALVVGCGLGDDAEALAERGFQVTAFDISETAIQWAKERFPETSVSYQAADLFDTPEDWRGAFDFVLEIRTIQSMPHTVSDRAIAAIASFVKPGGTLLLSCMGRDPEQPRSGIPWPLSKQELAAFGENAMQEILFEDLVADGARRFRIEYRKQETAS